MKELYRYNRAGKLIEQPRMQKPNRDDFIRAVAQPFFEVDIIFDGVKFDKAEKKYLQHIESLKSYDTFHTEWGDGDLELGKDFEIEYRCPDCGGDGKETCNNPDHAFVETMPGEVGRLGCPVCGHHPKHKVNNGKNTCPQCGGLKSIWPEQFEEYCRETGYDEEPVFIAVPIAPVDKLVDKLVEGGQRDLKTIEEIEYHWEQTILLLENLLQVEPTDSDMFCIMISRKNQLRECINDLKKVK